MILVTTTPSVDGYTITNYQGGADNGMLMVTASGTAVQISRRA